MKKILFAFLFSLIIVPGTYAAQWQIMGTRAMGMGGAFVGVAEGPVTQYWNPAGLVKHDEEAALNIHKSNRVRLERALEVYLLTGEKFSVLSKKNIKNNNFSFLKIALERNREHLYERINKRVEIMFDEGLIEEIKKLYKIYGEKLYKLNIIGYTEVIDYLNGLADLEKTKYEIKKNTRHYAKRQFTWFKADKKYKWYNLDEEKEENIIENIVELFKS